ncbi:hypothetical protein [Deinococcus sp. Marseille-Q6407]|uniref:hypothetical protein n=1 Tax=Deinococcus sp. Marseille-Q6407 TaxID=2969223 RepID=UPI0021BF5D29|nr:hypothetical protein [Deinococcus sp. Marseille-Q6407]
MMNAIARLAPALAVKPLNEPFRVTRRTANELVITTPLKPAGAVAGLFLGGGISNKSASITYYFQPQGNVTFVRSSVDAQGGELYQQRDAIDAMLDKTFARVTLP